MTELEEQGQWTIKKIEAALDVTGAGVGAIIGLLIGGPMGAVGGAMLSAAASGAAKGLLVDMLSRKLSTSEGERLEKTALGAAQDIHDRLTTGEVLRQDWFSGASADFEEAREVFEGVLISAQRDYEERKIKHYAYLLSSLAFQNNISRSDSNMLINLGESLSYRQLGLLAIFGSNTDYGLRSKDYSGEDFDNVYVDPILEPMFSEIIEMYNLGILRRDDDQAILGFESIAPSIMKPRGAGKMLYSMMKLNEFNIEDIRWEVRILCK